MIIGCDLHTRYQQIAMLEMTWLPLSNGLSEVGSVSPADTKLTPTSSPVSVSVEHKKGRAVLPAHPRQEDTCSPEFDFRYGTDGLAAGDKLPVELEP
jgi:hypothetical protein